MKYTVGEAVERLRRNKIQVDQHKKVVDFAGREIGIKLWGAVDYLCNYHKFRWTRGW